MSDETTQSPVPPGWVRLTRQGGCEPELLPIRGARVTVDDTGLGALVMYVASGWSVAVCEPYAEVAALIDDAQRAQRRADALPVMAAIIGAARGLLCAPEAADDILDAIEAREREAGQDMIDGYYYLHTNGLLIYRRELGDTAADLRESDYACAFWGFDPSDRDGAWTILVEALALGANPERVAELAAKWGCDDRAAAIYAARIGVTLDMDGDRWCAKPPWFVDLMESPFGLGSTALEALAELAKALGLSDGKTWRPRFVDLLRVRESGR